jgi:hypothetical protein
LRKWRNPLSQGEVEIDWRIFTRLLARDFSTRRKPLKGRWVGYNY